jgi:hypothetical protein
MTRARKAVGLALSTNMATRTRVVELFLIQYTRWGYHGCPGHRPRLAAIEATIEQTMIDRVFPDLLLVII